MWLIGGVGLDVAGEKMHAQPTGTDGGTTMLVLLMLLYAALRDHLLPVGFPVAIFLASWRLFSFRCLSPYYAVHIMYCCMDGSLCATLELQSCRYSFAAGIFKTCARRIFNRVACVRAGLSASAIDVTGPYPSIVWRWRARHPLGTGKEGPTVENTSTTIGLDCDF